MTELLYALFLNATLIFQKKYIDPINFLDQ